MILYYRDSFENEAAAYAAAYGLNASPFSEKKEGQVCLVLGPDGLSLTDGKLVLRGDFSELLPRVRPERIGSEVLVRAAKRSSFLGTPTLFDATAGLGEDSFLLAAAGFSVTLAEKNAVIAALLADALVRGRKDPRTASVCNRMTLLFGDSLPHMKEVMGRYDVIYLDPMFPARQKSGLVKKKFQLLGRLEAPEENGGELLAAALASGASKILIKRPHGGEFLGGVKPHYTLSGGNIRVDCFSLKKAD